MLLFVEIGFEAAHSLPAVPPEHKCARVHGHSYRVRIEVEGPVDEDSGWVMDFAELKDEVEPLRAELDHRYLNDLEGLENPTAENIARWLWGRLAGSVAGLSAVEVRETPTAGCVYRGS